jgi:hypothetical protein
VGLLRSKTAVGCAVLHLAVRPSLQKRIATVTPIPSLALVIITEGLSLFEREEPRAVCPRKRHPRVAVRVIRGARLDMGCTAEARGRVPDVLLAGISSRGLWPIRIEVVGAEDRDGVRGIIIGGAITDLCHVAG